MEIEEHLLFYVSGVRSGDALSGPATFGNLRTGAVALARTNLYLPSYY